MRLGAYWLGGGMTLLVLATACTAEIADEGEEDVSTVVDGVVTTDGLSPDALGIPSNGAQTVPSTGALTVPSIGTLTMLAEWQGGYCADVSVTNRTSTPATSWTVVLDLNESTVNSLWNAESSQSGSILTVRPRLDNAKIPAGGSTSFGFCATSAGRTYRPAVLSVTQS